MTNEEFKKLNEYLNDILIFLSNEYPEVLLNLKKINEYSYKLYSELQKYQLKSKRQTNKMTYEDIYLTAQEIIKTINSKYLDKFKDIIETGKLHFCYHDSTYYDDEFDTKGSEFLYSDIYEANQLIKIDRKFNYTDVNQLIHEFTHYLNYEFGNPNIKNRDLLTEFLAIYFEIYANEYLLDSGIDKKEINYQERLLKTIDQVGLFSLDSTVFLAYLNLGNLNKNTSNSLDKLKLPVNVESREFKIGCKILYDRLKKVEIDDDNFIYYKNLTLAIFNKAKYIMGLLLAFYAKKNNTMTEVLWINDNILKYDDDVVSFLKFANIDIDDKNFIDIALNSIDEYIDKYKSMVIK